MSEHPQTLRDRSPVWVALSEFFLDTELEDCDYRRIARILAQSPYAEDELRQILRFEVYPVCHWNLWPVAGEWAGFNQEWLIASIRPLCGWRPLIRLPCLSWWMIRDHWNAVCRLLSEERTCTTRPRNEA